ncbi:DUF2510 domain-containing protein [Cellulosimicrobium sp. NPDC057127]|uniref:DUF2510 domain-containing protein n=1 Tax=Cellulosimicrobium sp. NPDC057127 TaxID=3346026 RepID=UPI003634E4D0
MSTAPAGWYADAQRDGHERWFDGRSWTEERRPVGMQQTNTPAGRLGWLPAATAFVALLVVLCGGALVLAGAAIDTVDSVVSSE